MELIRKEGQGKEMRTDVRVVGSGESVVLLEYGRSVDQIRRDS